MMVNPILKFQNVKKSLESDYELNNRDDESYHQSHVGRKSKVSISQFSKANTNAIESNLNYIENQVNSGA
jgi:hypothetical protein